MRKNNKLKLIAIIFVFLFYAFLNVQGTNAIYRDTFNTKVYLTIQNNVLTVNFDSDGTIIRTVTREYGDPVGELPSTSKSGYRFLGWYTDETGGEEIDETTPILSDTTFYARFLQIVCKKATTLHTQTCLRTHGDNPESPNADEGCLLAGYANGDTIKYGTLTNDYGVIPGDAYDCDVNDDGTFDPATERFYFLRKNGDNATLVHFTNFSEGREQLLVTSSSDAIYSYSQVSNVLPDSTVWTNETLIKFDGLPSRIATHDDINAACTDLKKCPYLFENSKFAGFNLGRTGIWLQQEGSTQHRLMSSTVTTSTKHTDNNSIRPTIEIPFDSLENNKLREKHTVTFNSMGGSAVPSITDYDGTKLGTLATPVKEGGSFIGWFTEEEGGTQINENTVITKNITYYAHYNDVATVTFNPNGGTTTEPTREVHVGAAVGTLPTATRGTDEFEGWYTEAEGGTKITSSTVINANITFFAHYREKVVVTFNVNGGENLSFESKEVYTGDPVGELPTATKGSDTFVGWYTDNTFKTEVTEETIVTGETEYIALWEPETIVAVVNGEGFTTLAAAINAVPNNTHTVVKVIKDIALNNTNAFVTIPGNKDIELELEGFTISSTTSNIFRVSGKMLIKNGTLRVTTTQGVVNVLNGGTLTVSGGLLENTNGRQAVYVEGGTAIITEDAYLKNKTDQRPALQVFRGSAIVLGGKIENTNGVAVGIGNEGTSLVIGSNEDPINHDSPVMIGKTYALDINSNKTATVYDGVFKGKTAAINDESRVVTEDGIEFTHTTEEDYKVAYLVEEGSSIVTFDGNGGTPSEPTRTVNNGDPVGELPTATPVNSSYELEGWYTEAEGGTKITEETIITENVTYYAHYVYNSSDEIIEHNIISKPVKTFLANASTWASGQTDDNHSSYDSKMLKNLNDNNCKYFKNYDNRDVELGGSVYCDQPEPYDTKVSGTIKVYKSDTSKTKGAEATYVTVKDGKIYNMIPGEIYKWELSTDTSVYGYIKAIGERRLISIDNATDIKKIRNVRDLGGIKVDKNGDGTIDGTIKYGILYRGEAIIGTSSAQYFTKLGIQNEMDLREKRASGESILPRTITKPGAYTFQIKHYAIDPESTESDERTKWYVWARDALTKVMQEVVDGDDDYAMYFHCRIGADRTGTLAYLIEGILGAPEEERYKDYEITYYYGFTDRTRFYKEKLGDNPEYPADKKFKYLREIMTVNGKEDVYTWYMKGSTDVDADNALIEAFKDKMIKPL